MRLPMGEVATIPVDETPTLEIKAPPTRIRIFLLLIHILFFLDLASLHTYPVNPAYESALVSRVEIFNYAINP